MSDQVRRQRAPERPRGHVIADGQTWWLTLPGDRRGWRRAHWALVRKPDDILVFWHAADDRESGALAELPGADEARALEVCHGIIRTNDLAHLTDVLGKPKP